MICTDIEGDLRDLERLISRVVPDKAAPLARWRERLQVLLERDGLIPLERQQLTVIIERIIELQRETGARRYNA
ncbi:hypothetical protein WN982_08575 [Paraburkholderia sp. IMGN_8]|uniref:hypothetical protein n=1 Tax=Paraburkholderia sp. IMGN_8 TaxID=3136564 RepID=UPI0031016FE4